MLAFSLIIIKTTFGRSLDDSVEGIGDSGTILLVFVAATVAAEEAARTKVRTKIRTVMANIVEVAEAAAREVVGAEMGDLME